RHRADQRASGTQDAHRLGDERRRLAYVLEQLARDDDVEALAVERQRLLGIAPVRLDPELRRLGQRFAIDVDADDLVPVEVAPGERAVAAAEVEDAPAGPADVAAEELRPLRPGEDEVAPTGGAVVLAVALAQLL